MQTLAYENFLTIEQADFHMIEIAPVIAGYGPHPSILGINFVAISGLCDFV